MEHLVDPALLYTNPTKPSTLYFIICEMEPIAPVSHGGYKTKCK
jgi:hypothetical protein